MPSLCGVMYVLWLWSAQEGSAARTRIEGGDMDLVFVGITVLFFVVSGWLVSALEKL